MLDQTLAWVQTPSATAVIKQSPDHFVVHELLGFDLTGEGEHLWLYIEKTGLTTADCLRVLAEQTGTASRDIGYSGLKDKHAVTRQWFSLPGLKQDVVIEHEALCVIEQKRHDKKLQRGNHKANQFELVLTDFKGDAAAFESSWQRVTETGVPNYFGPQRFGTDGQNIVQAKRLFAGKIKPKRFQRGIYLSAARSYLFNQLLSSRVQDGNWNRALAGDALMLAGSHSFFHCEQLDASIEARVQSFDVSPSGPLVGKKWQATTEKPAAYEELLAQTYPEWFEGLAKLGMKTHRRPFVLHPENTVLEWQNNTEVKLRFSLPTGAFATTLLRELIGEE